MNYGVTLEERFKVALESCPLISLIDGRPMVAGTDIPVFMVLAYFQYSREPEKYYNLTYEQVNQALIFAQTVLMGDNGQK